MAKSILNLTKTRDILDALLTLNVHEARAKALLLVLDSEEKEKEPIIKDIHEGLKKHGVNIAYKNCAVHIKELEKHGLVKLNVVKDSRGQKTIVKPTTKAHKVANLLFSIKDTFT